MRSGWLEYRKKSIDLVLRRHKFDGVYYDHTWPRVCRHPGHLEGQVHTDVEELLDFLRWTRYRVGPDGYVFLHNSATPTMVGENLADLVYLGEHTDPSTPLPGRLSPDMEFVPIAPRNGIIYGPWKSNEQAVLIHMLEGWPTVTSISTADVRGDDFTLDLYKALSRYGLDNYSFIRAGERPVDTGHPDVFASAYFRPKEALLFCANIGKVKTVATLRPDLTRIGWNGVKGVRVTFNKKTITLSPSVLGEKGIPVYLPPNGYAIIKIDRTT